MNRNSLFQWRRFSISSWFTIPKYSNFDVLNRSISMKGFSKRPRKISCQTIINDLIHKSFKKTNVKKFNFTKFPPRKKVTDLQVNALRAKTDRFPRIFSTFSPILHTETNHRTTFVSKHEEYTSIHHEGSAFRAVGARQCVGFVDPANVWVSSHDGGIKRRIIWYLQDTWNIPTNN